MRTSSAFVPPTGTRLMNERSVLISPGPRTELRGELPDWPAGDYQLRITARTPDEAEVVTRQVRLRRPNAVLLTSDKPVYQPGQTMHIRALALDRANHNAAANRPLTFEVEDSRGNKVFKKATSALWSAAVRGKPPSGCLAIFGSRVALRLMPVQ